MSQPAGAAYPTGYPTELVTSVELSDGAAVVLRPIMPADAAALRLFHARQSPDSIYFRYFTPHPTLSDREVERFTTVDYQARLALVGFAGADLIGVGRYEQIGGEPRAEVAFFVDDAYHGHGLATRLLEGLIDAAPPRGIHHFEATVLPDNHAMLAVFAAAGFAAHTNLQDGIVEVVLDLKEAR